jgi:hypothetical protein
MTDVARQIADTRFRKLVSVQIEGDGRQPFELLRTRSFDYSVLNLLGLFKLASIGQQIGLNLWTFVNSQGAGLKAALDYLTSNRQNWPHKQVTPLDTRGLDRLLKPEIIGEQSSLTIYKLEPLSTVDQFVNDFNKFGNIIPVFVSIGAFFLGLLLDKQTLWASIKRRTR